ncbi:hypothetical protein PVK06_005407 [Gossypium arboreum]|uniref:Uncharacterized protein n=1 Tax=Gossypium arboreum TaxID=29729 RepID=A0ABR0QUJ5_GOSAR|nr:hypothetical protein PVK06_005407 [Gossypium arboreum]
MKNERSGSDDESSTTNDDEHSSGPSFSLAADDESVSLVDGVGGQLSGDESIGGVSVAAYKLQSSDDDSTTTSDDVESKLQALAILGPKPKP